MNGFLIFLLLLNAYIVAVYLISRSPKLRGKVELVGPLVMWKTQRGKPTIDRIAAASPRFWERWGDAAIWVTWVSGTLIFALLVYQLYLTLTRPEVVVQNAPPPQYLLGLPGVNPLIPVGYGIVGLIIALVIHEGSHGILARVGKMGVKSLGLLFFIVPVGAFVEPDERDMEAASTRAKNRVFAAGPMANLALALVAGLVFSTAMMGSVSVANDGKGVGVGSVVDDGPAAGAGLVAGDLIVSIDSTPMDDIVAFNTFMNGTKAGQVVTLETLRDGEKRVVSTRLADKYPQVKDTPLSDDPDTRARQQYLIEDARGKGFLGVSTFDMGLVAGVKERLQHPFLDGPVSSFNPQAGGSFWFYASYPFFALLVGVDILAPPYQSFVEVHGPLAALPPVAFFVIANFLYWLMWLNLMLGTFNALPAGPLDGGQMFKATLRERLFTWYKVDRSKLRVEHEVGVPGARLGSEDLETQEKLVRVNSTVKRATWTLGFFILGLILLPIVAPRVVPFLL